MLKKYLEICKITSVVGLRGEVKVQPWCDDPQLLCELETLYRKSGDPVTVEHGRVQKNMAVLKLEGVDTPDQAQAMRGVVLYMDRDDVELPEGSWFVSDLIGLDVRDSKSGESYGILSDVTETGANDVYHIKAPDGKLLLVPAIPDVIDSIDLAAGTMHITPLKGLFDI